MSRRNSYRTRKIAEGAGIAGIIAAIAGLVISVMALFMFISPILFWLGFNKLGLAVAMNVAPIGSLSALALVVLLCWGGIIWKGLVFAFSLLIAPGWPYAYFAGVMMPHLTFGIVIAIILCAVALMPKRYRASATASSE